MNNNPYETNKLLGEYLLFHYGEDMVQMPWPSGPKEALGFAVRTVSELLDLSDTNSFEHALDVGCAVGRSTFELAKKFSFVKGIDFSQAFIEAAEKLNQGGKLSYEYLEEGNFFSRGVARCPAHSNSVKFIVGDACNLDEKDASYDLVHAANLICRLPNPKSFISCLSKIIRPGGQLILATPFTWLQEYTPEESWIGNGNSESQLEMILSPHFGLEKKVDLPFLIREHRRKFQYSVALGTRWRRLEI